MGSIVIVVGGFKGGTGKSTIATNFAGMLSSDGDKVLLLDADPNHTATNWSIERSNDGALATVNTAQKIGKGIAPLINELKSAYQWIIVDTRGSDSLELREAISIADLVISPVRPSQFDVWTVESFADLVEKTKIINPNLNAYFVISQAHTNKSVKETKSALELLKSYENVQVCDSMLSNRTNFARGQQDGKTVVEIGGAADKASQEMYSLLNEIFPKGQNE